MTAADWARVRALFEEARVLDPAERDGCLAGSDAPAAVVAEVRSLLRVYEESPDFLDGESPVPIEETEPGATPLRGRRIGPWVLVREIGRGGMGIVWEAQRVDREYDQRVAMKLLPCSSLSVLDIERFREERQILARLDHPSIARLLDGGTADDQSPYLVMEFIDGAPLDDWCASRNLSVRERVRLFLPICDAVASAHRRLVIHRDLKPANILVTAEGTPKLLDFGIAKLLQPDASVAPSSSRTGRLLTPQFASPEQICGRVATTATDIYSLGATLFLLLAGRPHYDCESDDPLAIIRAVAEGKILVPSAVARASREIKGDLDAIVLRCLRQDPEDRYSSASALAADLSRWLDGRPVSARKHSRVQLIWKVVKRNKAQSAAATVALTAILAGAGVSIGYAAFAERERARAEARFNLVRQLAHVVIFDIHDAIQDLPGATPARRILVDTALQYLKELEATGAQSRELDLEIAAAYMKIGFVLANYSRGYLGGVGEAKNSYQRACHLARSVLKSTPRSPEATLILADAAEALSRLTLWQGDTLSAARLLDESTAIVRQNASIDPGNRILQARARLQDLQALELKGDWQGLLRSAPDALNAWKAAFLTDPPVSAMKWLIHIHSLAANAYKEQGDAVSALRCFREAQLAGEDVLRRNPGLVWAQMEYSFALLETGWLEHTLGKHEQSIAHYKQALAIQKRLADADPGDFWSRIEYAKLLNTAASAYEAAGRAATAVRMLREAAAGLDEARRHDPDNKDIQHHIAWVWVNLGDVHARAKRPREAVACYRTASELLRNAKSGEAVGSVGIPVGNWVRYLDAQLKLAGDGRPLAPAAIPGTNLSRRPAKG